MTDATDYPLFDVWIEMDCCRCTWVLEAYGKTVLLMHEKTGSPYCTRRSGGLSRVPPITITDWNGDLFGYLTPGKLSAPQQRTQYARASHRTLYTSVHRQLFQATRSCCKVARRQQLRSCCRMARAKQRRRRRTTPPPQRRTKKTSVGCAFWRDRGGISPASKASTIFYSTRTSPFN